MPTILNHNSNQYINPSIRRQNRKYNKTYHGNSLYLPHKKSYSEGDGLIDLIKSGMNFINNNIDNIKNIGSFVKEIGNATNNSIDTVKKIRELSEVNKRNKILDNIASNNESNGSGFFTINK